MYSGNMCSDLTDRKEKQSISSDMNPTMLAKKTFENILHQIQISNLNFHLQMSPFSAHISLKKTLVKDRSGTTLLPPSCPPNHAMNVDYEALASKNIMLERDLVTVTSEYQHAVDDCEEAHRKIQILEAKLEVKTEPSENDALVDQLRKENYDLRGVIADQKKEIKDVEI